MNEREIINPVKLTDEHTGKTYELDYDRDALRFMERAGFTLEDAMKHPVTGMSDLFYFAFRKNHRLVPREKTDKMIERWSGGVPEKLVKRLVQLYQQAESYNSILTDEEVEKNSGLILEL